MTSARLLPSMRVLLAAGGFGAALMVIMAVISSFALPLIALTYERHNQLLESVALLLNLLCAAGALGITYFLYRRADATRTELLGTAFILLAGFTIVSGFYTVWQMLATPLWIAIENAGEFTWRYTTTVILVVIPAIAIIALYVWAPREKSS
jgi:hypothetical protein